MPGINLLFYLQCHQNNTIRPKGGGLVKINNLKVFAVTETIYQHRSLVYKIWLWLKQHPLISRNHCNSEIKSSTSITYMQIIIHCVLQFQYVTYIPDNIFQNNLENELL